MYHIDATGTSGSNFYLSIYLLIASSETLTNCDKYYVWVGFIPSNQEKTVFEVDEREESFVVFHAEEATVVTVRGNGLWTRMRSVWEVVVEVVVLVVILVGILVGALVVILVEALVVVLKSLRL